MDLLLFNCFVVMIYVVCKYLLILLDQLLLENLLLLGRRISLLLIIKNTYFVLHLIHEEILRCFAHVIMLLLEILE